MKKTYKVITETFKNMYIEHFSTLETATNAYKKSIEYGCKRCYLLETEIKYQKTENSINKILSSYEQK